MDYRRLFYASRATGGDRGDDQIAILRQARANNGLNGVSGLLWTDGRRYLQILEGPPEAVSVIFDKIAEDDRHDGVRILSDTLEPTRLFADWSMASLFPGETDAELQTRLGRLLRSAPADIRAEFERAVAGSGAA